MKGKRNRERHSGKQGEREKMGGVERSKVSDKQREV